MMKNFVFLILTLLISFNNFAQDNTRKIYKDYGVWELENGNNKIAISAYVTVEKNIKNTKGGGDIFKYELYLESKSIYDNDTTETWLYGTKVFVDGVEVTSNQFPKGFTVAISTKPEKIYWYTTDKKDIDFSISWEKSFYEPRIRK